MNGVGRHAKAVAGVTLEHLGCREWTDDAEHTRWAATGRNENGFTYTTTKPLRRLYLNAARGTANRRTEADRPSTALMVGEGAALYKQGIPGIALAPLPSYLVRIAKDGELGKLDKRLFHGQLQTFAKAMTALDETSTRNIGKLLPPANA